MNPFNYVHLEDVGEDIRGSHIAIYVRQLPECNGSISLCVNFLDGRFRNLIYMPIKRLRDTLRGSVADPWRAYTLYLDLVLEWWSDVLYTFNNQLIDEVSFFIVVTNTVRLYNRRRKSAYSKALNLLFRKKAMKTSPQAPRSTRSFTSSPRISTATAPS
jgi:hypothetical protein